MKRWLFAAVNTAAIADPFDVVPDWARIVALALLIAQGMWVLGSWLDVRYDEEGE